MFEELTLNMRNRRKFLAFVFAVFASLANFANGQQGSCASSQLINATAFYAQSVLHYSSMLQIFTDYKFTCSGTVTQWDYIVSRVPSTNEPVFFGIWRQLNPPAGNKFLLVGATQILPASQNVGVVQSLILPAINGIPVQPGDMIGMHYKTGAILQPDVMSIPFISQGNGVPLPLPSRTIVWQYGDVDIYNNQGIIDTMFGATLADNIRQPALRARTVSSGGSIIPLTQSQVPLTTTATSTSTSTTTTPTVPTTKTTTKTTTTTTTTTPPPLPTKKILRDLTEAPTTAVSKKIIVEIDGTTYVVPNIAGLTRPSKAAAVPTITGPVPSTLSTEPKTSTSTTTPSTTTSTMGTPTTPPPAPTNPTTSSPRTKPTVPSPAPLGTSPKQLNELDATTTVTVPAGVSFTAVASNGDPAIETGAPSGTPPSPAALAGSSTISTSTTAKSTYDKVVDAVSNAANQGFDAVKQLGQLVFGDYSINGTPIWIITMIVAIGLSLIIVLLLVLLCYACCCRRRKPPPIIRPAMLSMETQTDLPYRLTEAEHMDRGVNTKRAWQEATKKPTPPPKPAPAPAAPIPQSAMLMRPETPGPQIIRLHFNSTPIFAPPVYYAAPPAMIPQAPK